MTTAAKRFLNNVEISWDSFEPWKDTTDKGLADVDQDALREFCGESGEDYELAAGEVLAAVRAKVNEGL